ncbi:hypothetical protein Pmani_021407 [Petrolisthes manimaculis]|uniref:Uncharacterized protein n=1 Tax=Petrolisthes manimaculis TaxID=1843537 RepID=A0AAE1PGD2_9EUCA|nr:hypothetical protein Pmani_021407 [Petrolisthes manimaculis]
MASNQVNLVEGVQAVGLSNALLDRAAEEARPVRSLRTTVKEPFKFTNPERKNTLYYGGRDRSSREADDGVVMEQPKDMGNLTKVFIAPYDRLLDPELLLDDDRVVWAKRHVVRGEKKKSVVVLVREEVPEKLHVLGNGYR